MIGCPRNRVNPTNAKNENTSFARNSYGQVISLTDGRAKTTSFGYDTYGNQTTVTNPLSKTWATGYDLAGRKTSVTDPLNHAASYAYDANDNLTSATDGRGKLTSYLYDNANNRTSATDPNLKATTFDYDEKNRLISVTDAVGGLTTYIYDANDNRTSMTDAENHSRSWTYDKNNRVLTETDALGKLTNFEYDGAGNRFRRIDAADAIMNYSYDTINRLTSVRYPSGDGSATVTYTYNVLNLRTGMTNATGTTTYAYDELKRLASVTFPGNNVVSYQYDAGGNRTRIIYPDAKTADYTYDNANRLASVTDWLTKVTSYSYDDAGRLALTTYPTGVTETKTYNDADQLSGIVASKNATNLTSFGYTLDNAGFRSGVGDLGGTESYTYDNLYRITGVTYPDASTQSYTYDGVGNRLTKVQGGTTNYTYDAGDRIIAAGTTTYSHHDTGNLKSKSAGGTPTSFCYDSFDRLTRVTESTQAPACPVHARRINAGGSYYLDTTGNQWGADARFTGGTAASVTNPISNTVEDTLYQSQRYGNFSYTLPAENGTYTVTLKFAEHSVTAVGERKFDVAIEGTLVLDDLDVYAAAGGRYIAHDRSFTATVNDGTLDIAFTTVLRNSIVNAIEVVWAGASPSPALASYIYRGDGLRHSKTVETGTTTYTWDVNAGLPVILHDGNNTYLYGRGLISQTDGAGVQSYFLTDGLGSTRAVTDSSGNVTATYTYDVFGAVRTGTGTDTTEYQFTGQQEDSAVGLQYLRARYYDPAIGRFLSKDPFTGFSTNPLTAHPYAYVQNNPVNRVDPSGKFGPLVFGGVVIGGGELIAAGGIAAGAMAAYIHARQEEIQQAAQSCGYAVEEALDSLRQVIGTFWAERFTPDEEAAVDLAKEAKNKGGLSNEEADALLDEARNAAHGPDFPVLDHRGDKAHGAEVGDHIRIGPINHIPVSD